MNCSVVFYRCRSDPHPQLTALGKVRCSVGLLAADHPHNRPVWVSQKRPVHPVSQMHSPEPVIPSSHCPWSEQPQAVEQIGMWSVSRDLGLKSNLSAHWPCAGCVVSVGGPELIHIHSDFQKITYSMATMRHRLPGNEVTAETIRHNVPILRELTV